MVKFGNFSFDQGFKKDSEPKEGDPCGAYSGELGGYTAYLRKQPDGSLKCVHYTEEPSEILRESQE